MLSSCFLSAVHIHLWYFVIHLISLVMTLSFLTLIFNYFINQLLILSSNSIWYPWQTKQLYHNHQSYIFLSSNSYILVFSSYIIPVLLYLVVTVTRKKFLYLLTTKWVIVLNIIIMKHKFPTLWLEISGQMWRDC